MKSSMYYMREKFELNLIQICKVNEVNPYLFTIKHDQTRKLCGKRAEFNRPFKQKLISLLKIRLKLKQDVT